MGKRDRHHDAPAAPPAPAPEPVDVSAAEAEAPTPPEPLFEEPAAPAPLEPAPPAPEPPAPADTARYVVTHGTMNVGGKLCRPGDVVEFAPAFGAKLVALKVIRPA